MKTSTEILITAKTGKLEEIAILEDHVLLIGWLSTRKEILGVQLLDNKNRCIGSLETGGRVLRRDIYKLGDVPDIHEQNGFVYLLKKERFFRTGSLAAGYKIVFTDPLKKRILKTSRECLHVKHQRNRILEGLLKNWTFEIDIMNQDTSLLHQVASKIINCKSGEIQKSTIGKPTKKPKGSIIIPIYGRFDFIKFQLCKFSTLGGLEEFEIIYVIDDPTIRNEANYLATQASELYNLPIILIFLEKNVGFGMANNIGVEYATAENIILLNSDVLPTTNSWAHELISKLESLPNAGIVAPRLLFHDGTIQHNGMDNFKHPFHSKFSLMYHPQKGLHERFAQNTGESFQSPLLTGACLVMKKQTFNEINGFDPSFLIGDFEDGDLCQKINKTGLINYLVPDVRLIHLERQSQGLFTRDFRSKISMLNAITYNKKWLTNG